MAGMSIYLCRCYHRSDSSADPGSAVSEEQFLDFAVGHVIQAAVELKSPKGKTRVDRNQPILEWGG